ncbi:helix-turn-helix domain-containing protein, partial [Streptomyces sp. MCAF7]
VLDPQPTPRTLPPRPPDPRLAARPIQATATSWGFSRPGDFTRAFRGAYGMSPSEYRHALSGGAECWSAPPVR